MDSRRVSLLVGRKSYNILTPLDEESLRDVYGIVHDIAAETDPSTDQDERLFIVSMTLANELVALSRRIDAMNDRLASLPGLSSAASMGGLDRGSEDAR